MSPRLNSPFFSQILFCNFYARSDSQWYFCFNQMLIRCWKWQFRQWIKLFKNRLTTIPESKYLLGIPDIGPVYTLACLQNWFRLNGLKTKPKLPSMPGFIGSENNPATLTVTTKTGNYYLVITWSKLPTRSCEVNQFIVNTISKSNLKFPNISTNVPPFLPQEK